MIFAVSHLVALLFCKKIHFCLQLRIKRGIIKAINSTYFERREENEGYFEKFDDAL